MNESPLKKYFKNGGEIHEITFRGPNFAYI